MQKTRGSGLAGRSLPDCRRTNESFFMTTETFIGTRSGEAAGVHHDWPSQPRDRGEWTTKGGNVQELTQIIPISPNYDVNSVTPIPGMKQKSFRKIRDESMRKGIEF